MSGRFGQSYQARAHHIHQRHPLDTLTFAAACTSTIKLGTSVLDIPYYNPVMLARRLSTIDVLSKGRLRVGFGVGWSPDEMEAAGADMKVRGPRADEFLQVLVAVKADGDELAGFAGLLDGAGHADRRRFIGAENALEIGIGGENIEAKTGLAQWPAV